MRIRIMASCVLGMLGVILSSPSALLGEEAKVASSRRPTATLRFQSINTLVSNARYLAKLAGREEEARQIERMLQARTGPKGLEGVDPKKAFGVYAYLNADRPRNSSVVAMVPISDQKAFIKVLTGLNLKPEKGTDGLYTVFPENIPIPFYMRFANGYVYATAQNDKAVAKGNLLAPRKLFAGFEDTADLQVNLDQIPAKLKRLALGEFDRRLADAKENGPAEETAAQKKLRLAVMDVLARHVQDLVKGGKAIRLGLSIDQVKGELSTSVSIKGLPGSQLAKDFLALSGRPCIGASLAGENSAANFAMNVGLPEKLRKVAGPVIDALQKEALNKEGDPRKRKAAKIIFKALEPTLKAGQLDMGVDLRGPSTGDKYTILAGLKVRKGSALEKTIKDLIARAPAEDKKNLTVDFAKVGTVNIHQVQPKKSELDEGARDLLGNHPIYFALREDALLVGLGPNGLEGLKQAIKAVPARGKILQGEFSLLRLAPLMAKENKAAPEVARKVFTGRGDDKIRMTLSGGDSLELRFSARAKIVAFISLVEKAKNEE